MIEIREEVRQRYAEAAVSVNAGQDASCCDSTCCGGSAQSVDAPVFGSLLYDEAERADLPQEAILASLGCSNPTAVADLHAGEVVLDLGSGGGIDVLLSAKRVGPEGKAYGLDMTDEMLDLAQRNQKGSGVENVEFLKGYIEEVPLPDAAVDVVISNCVINLSADKQRVFDEMARVLRPGGRIGVSDVVSSDALSHEERAERGSYVGCIAGALSFGEYEAGLRKAGFIDVSISPTHPVVEGMVSAIVKATKPVD